nr:protein lsm12 [Hymenolepis microstoma]
MVKDLRIGNHVEFTSHDGKNLSGEILFSDESLKYFVFQQPSKKNGHNAFDIYLFPHDSVKELRVTKQNGNVRYPEIDLDKVSARSRSNQKTAQERLKLFEAGVPMEVRELFDDLSRTLPASDQLQVRWKNPFIHVLEHTVIKPPYTAENVQEKSDSQKAKPERDYVKKLVEKFYSERKKSS